MQENETQLELVEKWTREFKLSMEEQIAVQLDIDPDADKVELKELYFINKIATLLVAMKDLGDRVRFLENKLNSK